MLDSASSLSSAQILPPETDKLTTTLQIPSMEEPASMKEPKTTKTFTLFPQLTPELRIHIWRSYLQTPRVITISAHPSAPTSQTNSNQSLHIARHAPSALLSVNSEARHEAISHYSKLPAPETVARDRLPYHIQHKSSTKGFYRAPGEDVVYLRGCYYDSRWFRGVGVVGREVIASLSVLLSLSLDPNSGVERERESGDRGVDGEMKQDVPLVGTIKTLALDEAFLSDETLFGRPEVSPVMVYLMRDLKGLERLIVVRTEGEDTDVEEIESRIEDARRKLVWQCELWGYVEEVEELEGWKFPHLSVIRRRELGVMCGEYTEE